MRLNIGNTILNELYWGGFVKFIYLGSQMVFQASKNIVTRICDRENNGSMVVYSPDNPDVKYYGVDCSKYSKIIFTIDVDVDDTCSVPVKVDGGIMVGIIAPFEAGDSRTFKINMFNVSPGEKKTEEIIINLPEDIVPGEDNHVYIRGMNYYCYPIVSDGNYDPFIGKFTVNFKIDVKA